jgi:lysine/ornithine N-monooxygenase
MQDASARCFNVTLAHRQDQCITVVTAKAAVLVVGTVGRPMINLFLNKVPNWRMWNHPDPVPTHESDILPKKSLPVLVVGGGLTAVQVALKELSRRRKEEEESETPHVILLSKRPLAEKHVDINVEWFDMRTRNKCMSDFYHHPMKERKRALAEARQG